jgi:RNA polymerase sigma-70 factor (ECF subfamily)
MTAWVESTTRVVPERTSDDDRSGVRNFQPLAVALPTISVKRPEARGMLPSSVATERRSNMGFGIGTSDKKQRLERMFRAHHELIWRTLCRLGMSRDSAADATQQAFLIAAERLDDIRAGCERAFVLNTALRLGRSADRKGRRCDLSDDMDIHPDHMSSRENVAHHFTAKSLLDQILADMDPDLIATFILFELEGMSTAEIAETLDIPAGTVASRLRRGREAFRARAARLDEAQKFDAGNRDLAMSPQAEARPNAIDRDGKKRSWTAMLPNLLGRRSHMGAAE